MISIRQFETTRMYTNTYICFDEDTREGFILDVGECTEDILSYIKRNNIKIRYIILTHGHFDHICGVADFLDLYPNALVIMHKEDIHMISDKTNLAYQNGETVRQFKVDITIEDTKEMDICSMKTKFMSTPGHTAGSMIVMLEDYMFSGDTLFYHGIGATNFPTGNLPAMIRSISRIFCDLDKNYRIFPGHGNSTTVEHEREHSKFDQFASYDPE